MAKRGDAAREKVSNTIANAFAVTGDYVTTADKKIYVTARDGDNGELLQFAISITMPKVPMSAGTFAPGGSLMDEEIAVDASVATPKQTDLSPDDKAKVADLMVRLGLA